MAAGGLSMWLLNPMFWLWLTSRTQDGLQPSMGPYGLLLLGIVLTCVAIGKGISVLHRHYEHRTGSTPTIRIVMPWRRSLRGGRSQQRETDGRLPLNVLDVIMTLSVMVAIFSFAAWYLVVQPTPPGIGGSGPAKH